MSTRTDYQDLSRSLAEQGWTVTPNGAEKWKAVPPGAVGNIVFFSVSQDPRALHNTIRDLKRSGFEYPPPKGKPVETKIATGAQTLKAPPGERAKPAIELPAATPDRPSSAPKGDPLDQAFQQLREAREWLAMCQSELDQAREAFAAANREMGKAQTTTINAEAALRKAKADFDALFTTGAPS